MSGNMTQEGYTVTPTTAMILTTGTWTQTQSSGVVFASKATAAETTTVTIPVLPPLRRSDQYGAKLTKIEIPVRVGVADLTGTPTATLYRQEDDLIVSGATGDVVAATVTSTFNGVVTFDANDRLWTVTVSSSAFDYDTEAKCTYNLVLSIATAASTTLRVYAAKAFWEALV